MIPYEINNFLGEFIDKLGSDILKKIIFLSKDYDYNLKIMNLLYHHFLKKHMNYFIIIMLKITI